MPLFGEIQLFREAANCAVAELASEQYDRSKYVKGEKERSVFYANRSRWLDYVGQALCKILTKLQVPDDWEELPDPDMSAEDFIKQFPDAWKEFVGIFKGMVLFWGRLARLETRRGEGGGGAREVGFDPDVLANLARDGNGPGAASERTLELELSDPQRSAFERWWAARVVWTYRTDFTEKEKQRALEVHDEVWPLVKETVADGLRRAGLDDREYNIMMAWASILAKENRDKSNRPRRKKDVAASFDISESALTKLVAKLGRLLRTFVATDPLESVSMLADRLHTKLKAVDNLAPSASCLLDEVAVLRRQLREVGPLATFASLPPRTADLLQTTTRTLQRLLSTMEGAGFPPWLPATVKRLTDGLARVNHLRTQ